MTPTVAAPPKPRSRPESRRKSTSPPASSPSQKAVEDALSEKESEPEEKVLDLTTLARPRRTVKLPTKDHPEGEMFEIRLLDDFGVQKQQQLLTWSRRYDKLYNRDDDQPDLQDEDLDKLKWYLDSMFEEILDAPKVKKNQMTDSLRQRVVLVFSMAPALLRDERNAMEFRRGLFGELIQRKLISQEEFIQVMTEMSEDRQEEMNSILVS